MGTIAPAATWRDVWVSRSFGRFVLLCLGIWLHAADTLVTATLVPTMVGELGGVAYVAWTISLYQIGAVVAGAATAAQCRRFGVKRVLAFAAADYGLGCVIAAVAPTMPVLLAARLVQGAGGGILIALSYVAIQQSFADRLWGRLFGVTSMIWGAGSLLGPLIGGVFVSFDAWRLAFWFFAVQAGVLCGASTQLEGGHQAAPPAGRPPVLPIILLLVGSALIAEAGVVVGRGLSLSLCLAGSGLLLTAGLVDRRSRARLLPKQSLDLRHPIGAGLLTVFLLSVATTGFWAYGPLLLNILFGTNPLTSGYMLAGEALAWSTATILVAGFPASSDRVLIRSGVSLIVAGAAGFAVVVPAGSFAGMVTCTLLQGLGFGVCWPSIIRRVVQCAGENERMLAAAAPGTLQRIGYAVGAAATGIAANASGLAEGMTATAAREAGFWVFAAFLPVLSVSAISAWRFTSDPPGCINR